MQVGAMDLDVTRRRSCRSGNAGTKSWRSMGGTAAVYDDQTANHAAKIAWGVAEAVEPPGGIGAVVAHTANADDHVERAGPFAEKNVWIHDIRRPPESRGDGAQPPAGRRCVGPLARQRGGGQGSEPPAALAFARSTRRADGGSSCPGSEATGHMRTPRRSGSATWSAQNWRWLSVRRPAWRGEVLAGPRDDPAIDGLV